MKTKCVATIIGLSPRILPVIKSALWLLNLAEQDDFIFELGGSSDHLPSTTSQAPRLWSELEAVLVGERRQRKCELLVAVLDDPIEHNWFSHAAYGKNVAWITANDWEFYSNLPVASFVAYDIVLNVLLLQLVTSGLEEAWLMGAVVHVEETRECISDLCAYKPDISRKIRSGRVCPDCQKILAARLGTETLAAVSTLLETICKFSFPTQPAAAIKDFPALSHIESKTNHFLKEAQLRAMEEQSRLEKIRSETSESKSRLKSAEHRGEIESKHVRGPQAMFKSVKAAPEIHACTAEPGPFLVERPGLPDHVERRYPFPIAYCFRSMRAELSPTDRWDTLFELYALIVRYVAFALLSGLRHQQRSYPEELKPLIQKLKFGFAGDWGKACIALLKHWQKSGNDSFFKQFVATVSQEKLGQFEQASRSLVQTRNSIEHGFRGDKQGCLTVFDRHLPDVKNMLQFIEPLADYVLIRPMQIIENIDGQCIYFSKVMAGSDPQFLPQQMISSSVPETVCQLLSPEGETLTLHPWVHLNRCNSCLREMVFVYDAIHMKDGEEAVLLREYPSNHEQRQAALVPQVKKLLGV